MKTLLTSACIIIFILKGSLSKNIGSTDIRQCYWCGPLADQVNKSQRPSPCDNGTLAITTCDHPQQYCAIVASAPPYIESRLCVKIYQDECYPLYCNTTRSWKMTCPCKGDLCNGNKTDREEDAFAGLNKLVARIPKRDKRDLDTHKDEEIKPGDENGIKDDVRGITNETNNLKDDIKGLESNIANKVEDKDSNIVNMANDSMHMKITTATVTPSTMEKDKNSETKTTGNLTSVDSLGTEIKKEEKQKKSPTQTQIIQKDVTVPDILEMQNDGAPKTENMQNVAAPKIEIMQNDAAPTTENMQNDAAPKPETMPKDSAQPSANHETEKSLPKGANLTENNIERPPVTPSKENKKNNDPYTTTAPKQDMNTNATLPGKVYNISGKKQQKNYGVMQSSSLFVSLIPILGCKFLV